MKTMHLFAGAGGGLLADLILGHTPIVAVEWDAYCCKILRERAADGWFPGLHVHEGDVRLFDPSDYAGRVDIVHAGFPCQDLSNAGNRAGLGEGTRSGLYREVLRIAGMVRPRYLFLENVSAILSTKEKILATVCGWAREPGYLFNASNLREKRGFLSRVFEIANSVAVGIVLGDLAARGYDCRWTCLPASATGAPHYRDRWWCLAERADAASERCREAGQLRCNEPEERITGDGETVADAHGEQLRQLRTRCDAGASRTNQETEEKREWLWPDAGQCGQAMADTHSDSGEQGGPGNSQKRKAWGYADRGGKCQILADSMHVHGEGEQSQCTYSEERSITGEGPPRSYSDGLGWWSVEPDVGRVDHGVAARVDRIKALGNGQVPLQAALAWRMLTT